MQRLALGLLLLSSSTFAGGAPADGGAVTKRRGRTLAEVKLVYFHATWCSSCKRLDASKVLERLKERQPGLVDVDTHEVLLERYGVTHTPTLLLVDSGGFPLGKAAIELEKPDLTLERLEKLVKKMVKP